MLNIAKCHAHKYKIRNIKEYTNLNPSQFVGKLFSAKYQTRQLSNIYSYVL